MTSICARRYTRVGCPPERPVGTQGNRPRPAGLTGLQLATFGPKLAPSRASARDDLLGARNSALPDPKVEVRPARVCC